jgi:uncharacterized delta-60 repeat protein
MKHLKKSLVIVLCFSSFSASQAQTVSLDPGFGSAGKITSRILSPLTAKSVLVQPDGKILVLSFASLSSARSAVLFRYQPDGRPDISFDGDGVAEIAIEFGGDNLSRAMALQNDGKIVIVGGCRSGMGATYNDFAVMRLNSDGSVDNTFGTSGKVITPVSSRQNEAYTVAIQKDGKIILGGVANGSSYSNQYALVRYRTDGTLDPTFDGDGIVVTTAAALNGFPLDLKIQTDGKILLAGAGSIIDMVTARFNIDGSLDNLFNSSGYNSFGICGGGSVARSLALQPDGKIVVAGFGRELKSGSSAKDTNVMIFSRLNANGTLDYAFGGSGVFKRKVGDFDAEIYAAAIQVDGKIIAVGYSADAAGNIQATLVRYNSNGTPDLSFGTDGLYRTNFDNTDKYQTMALQSDGKLVAAGFGAYTPTAGGLSTYQMILARYVFGPSSISEASNGSYNRLKVYPNPGGNQSVISLLEPLQNVSVSITNSLGQQIRAFNDITGQSFIWNHPELPAGIYFVQLLENGTLRGVERLVIGH